VGIVPPAARVHELDIDTWNRVLSINVTGAMLMARFALPHMIERGGGAIVNISSTGARVSTGRTPAYGASKAGLERLTADLAVGYGRDGIRANAILPGHIQTPLVANRGTERARLERQSVSPLGNEGDAWDVAWAAVFLASDEARWITGVCLPVDGGLTQVSPLTAHRWLEALPADDETRVVTA
jgi:NAD(P)-dependent dehydrogenase (short-subunit alcohol dehydrogenase family)